MGKLSHIFLLELLNTWELRLKERIKNAKDSSISNHLLQCDFPTTFVDFDILAPDSNKFKLLIKESLIIKCDKAVLNRTTKSFPLDLFD